MEPPYYRTSFSKHLHSLARSNYFAHRLDWDDRQFLEYVKKTGLANGSVPSTNVVLLEELEFWGNPYTVHPYIERRVGKRPRPYETQEQYELRKARSNRWHAQRIIRENERAIAAAELAREQREHAEAQAKRKAREAMTDAEWEAAAPKLRFGKMTGRHFIPQWKLDERGELNDADAKKAKRLEKERLKKEAAEIERQRDERITARVNEMEAAAKQRESDRVHVALAREAEATRTERQRVIDEAWANVRRLDRIIGVQGVPVSYTGSTLRGAIMTLLNSTPGHVWTREEMARSLGVTDMAFLENCLNELVVNGHLKKMDRP